MAYLVTGGCGFVGSNLAAHLISKGETVLILDNLSRQSTLGNLAWLRTLGDFHFFHGDVRNSPDLEAVFRKYDIECVFHLAGQVAMATSLENPRYDFETNVHGSINVLENVRLYSPRATVVYASSNKVYGEMVQLSLVEKATRYEPAGKKDIDESARLQFCTPYGCSKGAADQYMQEYARSYGLNTVVFRHSTIYGGRQISTFEQGWVGWFCDKALEARERNGASFTINGDGKQVRDLLHVSDAVACYLAAHEHISGSRGQVMNIGGGYENSLSLRELFVLLEQKLGVELNPRHLPWRPSDQKYFVADNSKAAQYLGWLPKVDKIAGISEAIACGRARKND